MSYETSSERQLTVQRSTDRHCLILGGCGFLGSVVTRHLVAQGWHVRVFDKEETDASRLHSVASRIELMRGDFMNLGDLRRALEGVPVVLHFVGTTIPQSSMNDIQFDIETNVVPTIRLLELMVQGGLKRLIFSSSGGTVYGIAERRRPIPETHRTDPIAAYGISKLMTEKYIRLFTFNYHLPAVILRFANPYGETQQVRRSQGVVSTFVQKVLQHEPIHLWGDGSTTRDYLYEQDVATAVESVLRAPSLEGIFNVGTGRGTSLDKLLSLISDVFSKPTKVIREPSRSFDVPYNVLDISRITAATGWKPRYTLLQGLQKMKNSLS
jgi:UDP-glucose 4-epimerase